jgi:tellurite resistance protein TerC
MFRSFGLAPEAQRKALLLGIVGAIIMRGVFIFAGIALLERFSWIEYVFGALLLVAAVRLLRGKKKGDTPPEPAKWIGQRTRRWANSPKATFIVAVIAIELVDLVFAIDSVPAVLAISHHPFVVYTSNICAILGLRALYFLLAGLLERLRFLHFGLAAILAFVGLKMVTAKWVSVPVTVSLGFIVLVVLAATAASLIPATRYDGLSRAQDPRHDQIRPIYRFRGKRHSGFPTQTHAGPGQQPPKTHFSAYFTRDLGTVGSAGGGCPVSQRTDRVVSAPGRTSQTVEPGGTAYD